MALTPAIFVLGPSARDLGARLASHLGGTLIEPKDLRGELHRAFRQGSPIIGLCASAILIRLLAPLLVDKLTEPPVIAVAEDGSVAVPLLGGHHGANDLARRIVAFTGGSAAITTASDLRFGISLDKPEGYVLANPEHLKIFLAKLLAGGKISVKGEAAWVSALPRAAEAELSLFITEYAMPGHEYGLVYHPQTLALGIGCERGTPPDELLRSVTETLAAQGLAPGAIACIASLDLKADEPAVNELARHFGVPARFFSSPELNEETPRLKNPSETVLREVGCPGVAEAAALRAAGKDGELIVEKTTRGRTTCAIARAPRPIDPNSIGHGRGSLSIVGIGPGSVEWRSPAAQVTLCRATDWVGYDLYLDLIGDLRRQQREHRFSLGDEKARALHALNLAGGGRDVALVCSGDAGIYAMAALVFELLDPSSHASVADAARRIAIEVIPGISAFQAAAARAGALIGHDFCAISLSDLLTPWQIIEKRVRAAAEGDFVVAFYNPRSLKRADQLERAMAILKPYRHPGTPVIVASNLGRPGEKSRIARFGELDASDIDMLTIVLVGSASSRSFSRGDGSTVAYTPRGYAAKPRAQP
ncbi:MAG TPA: precorrin-3B C(17)-methyltransferase [Aestuariivirgaceae bacterium]|nr:precorrin-3B C(17)-methyltransferase [Aestuariivirgaceae bacterium]